MLSFLPLTYVSPVKEELAPAAGKRGKTGLATATSKIEEGNKQPLGAQRGLWLADMKLPRRIFCQQRDWVWAQRLPQGLHMRGIRTSAKEKC